MTWKKYASAKQVLATYKGRTFLFQSQKEADIAKELDAKGYMFAYDEKYPFEENTTKKRFDFMLLKEDRTEWPTKIFIEVKEDHEDHTDEMLKKEKLCAKHKAGFVYINEEPISTLDEKIKDELRRLGKLK